MLASVIVCLVGVGNAASAAPCNLKAPVARTVNTTDTDLQVRMHVPTTTGQCVIVQVRCLQLPLLHPSAYPLLKPLLILASSWLRFADHTTLLLQA